MEGTLFLNKGRFYFIKNEYLEDIKNSYLRLIKKMEMRYIIDLVFMLFC